MAADLPPPDSHGLLQILNWLMVPLLGWLGWKEKQRADDKADVKELDKTVDEHEARLRVMATELTSVRGRQEEDRAAYNLGLDKFDGRLVKMDEHLSEMRDLLAKLVAQNEARRG